MVLQLGVDSYRIAVTPGGPEGGDAVPYGQLATYTTDGECHYIALVEDPDLADRAVVHEVRGGANGSSLSLIPSSTSTEDVDFGDEDEDEDDEDDDDVGEEDDDDAGEEDEDDEVDVVTSA